MIRDSSGIRNRRGPPWRPSSASSTAAALSAAGGHADWLPESDFVHLVLDAVDQMDLSGFEAEYRGGAGQAPFAPAMMLAVLIYAYANGHRSSRKVERLCWRDVGFRMIVGDHVPDHSVIARFRRRHAERRRRVRRGAAAVSVGRFGAPGVVALDGTKVAANAALRRTARPRRSTRRSPRSCRSRGDRCRRGRDPWRAAR